MNSEPSIHFRFRARPGWRCNNTPSIRISYGRVVRLYKSVTMTWEDHKHAVVVGTIVGIVVGIGFGRCATRKEVVDTTELHGMVEYIHHITIVHVSRRRFV